MRIPILLNENFFRKGTTSVLSKENKKKAWINSFAADFTISKIKG
jgi:hypothetical protein